MEIYVGNWPSGADNYDLRKLFERDLLRVGIHRRMRGLFRRRQLQEKERYRVVIEQKNGVVYHYGLVVMEDDLAHLAIERLNGSNYRGNTLVVREWHTRAYQNDRRALNWRNKPWTKLERRRIERRESSLAPEDHPDF